MQVAKHRLSVTQPRDQHNTLQPARRLTQSQCSAEIWLALPTAWPAIYLRSPHTMAVKMQAASWRLRSQHRSSSP